MENRQYQGTWKIRFCWLNYHRHGYGSMARDLEDAVAILLPDTSGKVPPVATLIPLPCRGSPRMNCKMKRNFHGQEIISSHIFNSRMQYCLFLESIEGTTLHELSPNYGLGNKHKSKERHGKRYQFEYLGSFCATYWDVFRLHRNTFGQERKSMS